MNRPKIELSNVRCFGTSRRRLLAESIENFISHEKKNWLVAARNSQTIKIFLTLNLSQYSKSVSTFSSSKQPPTLSPLPPPIDSSLLFLAKFFSWPHPLKPPSPPSLWRLLRPVPPFPPLQEGGREGWRKGGRETGREETKVGGWVGGWVGRREGGREGGGKGGRGVAASRTAADLETCCVCARPSDPPKLCRSAGPRAWPLILQSKPSIIDYLLEQPLEVISRWPAGARTWTQNWTLLVLSVLKFLNNLCGVWIFFASVEDAELRTEVSQYQPSSTRLLTRPVNVWIHYWLWKLCLVPTYVCLLGS